MTGFQVLKLAVIYNEYRLKQQFVFLMTDLRRYKSIFNNTTLRKEFTSLILRSHDNISIIPFVSVYHNFGQ
jgi:hypothetical protein